MADEDNSGKGPAQAKASAKEQTPSKAKVTMSERMARQVKLADPSLRVLGFTSPIRKR